MNIMNGLIEATVMVSFPSTAELFGKIAEVVKENEIDLGEFDEKFSNLAEKIEESIAAQEEPVDITEEEQNFVYGLALLLDIR